MGRALEVITAYDTEAGGFTAGTYTSFTANTGQSFSIRQANGTPAAHLLAPWGQFQVAGYLQVKSPRMHDTTIGTTYLVRAQSAGFEVEPLAGLNFEEPAYSTDTLTVQDTTIASTTASVTNVCALPVYYDDIPGIDANLITSAQLASYSNPAAKVGDHYVSWTRPQSAGTAGHIGTGVLINSVNDQFKANHSYALVGYEVSAEVAAILIQGTDTGNLYVGGPGSTLPRDTRDWFVALSNDTGLATIPVIQANNKGATNVFVVDGQTTSTTITLGLIWQDLGVITQPAGV